MIVVIEARSKEGGAAKVVDRWGEPDSSKCVLAASMVDRKKDPVRVFYFLFLDFTLFFKDIIAFSIVQFYSLGEAKICCLSYIYSDSLVINLY